MSKHNSQTSPIKVKPENRLQILSDEEIDQIHQATLTVLKETGVRFPSKKALQIFADAGADVDFEKERVKIPSDLVEKALEKAPREYTLGSRGDPELDLLLDGTTTYLGTDGCGTDTVDFDTRKRRKSTKADVEKSALITDYLSSLNFYWPMVSAQDMSSSTVVLHELTASFTNTEKHVQSETIMGKKPAQYAIELATLAAGGKEELRKRPPFSCLICTIDPLAQDKEGIEGALAYAEAGVPVGFMAMPQTFSTAPGTLPGTLVVGNAEMLSAIVLMQLKFPGAPVFYAYESSGLLNPHTGGYFSSWLTEMVNISAVQLGKYYGIPTMSPGFGGGYLDESGEWEGDYSGSLAAFVGYLSGADLTIGTGLIEADTLLYPEKMLFDEEIFKVVKIFADGLQINQDTLALDEIMDVGPRGHFLTQKSTLENLDNLWDPGISQQWSPEDKDFRDPHEVATEKIQEILENHQPKPLDEKVKKEMNKIIKSAEEDLSSE